MTKNFKRIFLDTNVLIYQTFEDFDKEKHGEATNTFEYLAQNNYELFISSQILREFFSICTNGKFFEKPLSVEEAITKLKEYQDNFTVLFDTEFSITQLHQLALKYQVKKKNIHDANIVATMITNNIREIYTFNIKDFNYYKEIEVFKSST